MSSDSIDEYAYRSFCNFERQRVLSIFTDDEAIKMNIDTLWYDLNKYHYEDVELHYLLGKKNFIKTQRKMSFINKIRKKLIFFKIF